MRVLMPLPDHDFDVTEVAVPWKVLSEAGHEPKVFYDGLILTAWRLGRYYRTYPA